MEKFKITYQGIELEIERLPNGKFKKPNISQFTKQGLGCTWLDDCRIPYESDYDKKHQSDIQRGQVNAEKGKFFGGNGQSLSSGNLSGRFSANLLVSDDVLNDGKVSKTGDIKPHKQLRQPNSLYAPEEITSYHKGDSGSFSRYFDLDAWAVEKGVKDTFPFMIVPKASKSEKNAGLTEIKIRKCRWNNAGEWKNLETEYKNTHPTCKPVKLMSYLITLGSREGDLVLDPYIGSGTTGVACMKTNRNYIGFEIDEGYFEIAEKRIEHEERKPKGFF